jgi:membrane-bound lytic murein transglycosylase B
MKMKVRFKKSFYTKHFGYCASWCSRFIMAVFLMLNGISCQRNEYAPPEADPSSWIIDKKYIFNSAGQPVDSTLEALFQKLSSKEKGEIQISASEFKNLLKRLKTREVYSEQLIKYASPKSQQIQNKEHADYTAIFMRKSKLNEGVLFLRKYSDLLDEAEARYGVEKKDIVSILMWESGLGKYTGDFLVFNIFMAQILFLDAAQKYSVGQIIQSGERNPLDDADVSKKEQRKFDAIKTRAVDNLVALIRQCKQKGMDPLEQKGSWGGAIGYVQFMPYRMNYAVDGDGDHKIDLKNWPDAIFSVANYLKEFGHYKKTFQSRRNGIYSYNHSNSYVNGVIKYADEIMRRLDSP